MKGVNGISVVEVEANTQCNGININDVKLLIRALINPFMHTDSLNKAMRLSSRIKLLNSTATISFLLSFQRLALRVALGENDTEQQLVLNAEVINDEIVRTHKNSVYARVAQAKATLNNKYRTREIKHT